MTIVRSHCRRCGRTENTDLADGDKSLPAATHPDWGTLTLVENKDEAAREHRGGALVETIGLYLCPFCLDEWAWWLHAPEFELSSEVVERFGLDPTLRDENEQAFLESNGATSWTFPLIIRYLLIPSHKEN